MFNLINKRLIGISLLTLSIVLTGCGENSENEVDSSNEETTEVAETSTEQTLTDTLGNEVIVPANPERIIASYLEDHLIALGVTPVAQWSVQNGEMIQDYLQDDLKDVSTIPYDLPFEAVTSFEPDLHLIGSTDAVSDGKYDQYAKIAPTYVIGTEQSENWRENLIKIAEVLNLNDEATKILEEYDTKAEESKIEIKDAIGDESVAAIWLTNNQFFIVSETQSSGAVLYGDLDLTTPAVVKEISSSATGDWSAISLEELAELEADHLFLINSDQAAGIDLFEDPLWNNIPAVKNNHVYEFESDTSWLYTGPVANEQTIDHVLDSLVD